MRSDRQRLEDIREAIERIEKYAVEGLEAFEKSELIQTWIVHHLQIIGEATARLSERFRAEHPQVRWAEIVGMRNVLVHQYFGMDIGAVWNLVKKDLPVLKSQISLIMAKLDE